MFVYIVACSWFYSSPSSDDSAAGHDSTVAVTVTDSNVWWSECRQQLCVDD